MPLKKLHYLTLIMLLLSCRTNPPTLTGMKERVVATSLDTPWEILWGPDNQIWVTEREGKVSKIDPATGKKTLLLTISDVSEQTESGLLGMVLDPQFTTSPFVYLAYTYSVGGGLEEKIVKYTYSDNTLSSPQILLDHITANTNHDGCRLTIGHD